MLDYDVEMYLKRQIPQVKKKLKCTEEEARQRLLNELEEVNQLEIFRGNDEI